MKFAIVVVSLIYLGLYGQDRKSPPKPFPIPSHDVNQTFLKACADGERLFEKVRNKKADKNDLIDLVIKLEYDLITEIEKRTPIEIASLRPARACTKNIAERIRVFLKQESQKSNKSLKNKPDKIW
jgi:hypothetical protein